MRGKVADPVAKNQAARITPAYAGKSFYGFLRRSSCQDHPRLCGEKRLFSVLHAYHKGSPPPMRGKASPTRKLSRLLRITPAYAGKRLSFCFPFIPFKDHPRLCGEKSSFPIKQPPTSGSPPPMRGKGMDNSRHSKSPRITPAYAGKSRDRGHCCF